MSANRERGFHSRSLESYFPEGKRNVFGTVRRKSWAKGHEMQIDDYRYVQGGSVVEVIRSYSHNVVSIIY